MFLVGLISWWYGRGWAEHLKRTIFGLKKTVGFFSIGQLSTTLFAPYRQISAVSYSDGSVGDKLRGVFDKLLSRIIGLIIRLFTIIAGLILICFQSIAVAVVLVVWWLIPFLPVLGFILFVIGWVPSW